MAIADPREVYVVTEEGLSGGPESLKIPNVCDLEGVRQIKFADMLDHVDLGLYSLVQRFQGSNHIRWLR